MGGLQNYHRMGKRYEHVVKRKKRVIKTVQKSR